MTTLSGKVALVTGSSRGIGRGIAERLAREGATVVVTGSQNQDLARGVVSAIEAGGGQAVLLPADLSRVANVRQLFQEILGTLGVIDIVVTNAGNARWGPIADVAEDDYDAVFDLNAKGTFFVLQEAARQIRDGGRIINVGSSATAMSFPGLALYAGSKAAGEQFAKTLAKELGPRGITVNTVSPGFTVTDMLPEDPAYRQMAIDMSFLGRLGQPDDIADVVAFLAGGGSRWITGQNIQVGGGVVA